MPTVRVVSREEAQQTHKPKAIGVRRARMALFDEYAKALIDHPDKAVVYADLGEEPMSFIMSLRKAIRRAGVPAKVRKMPRQDEVRAWRTDQATANPATPRRRSTSTAKKMRSPLPAKRTFTREDPLFQLIGIGEGKTPDGVSGRKHDALARAYRPQ